MEFTNTLHVIDEIEKAIVYMETVPVSTECYNAIVDMLDYEKQCIINKAILDD